MHFPYFHYISAFCASIVIAAPTPAIRSRQWDPSGSSGQNVTLEFCTDPGAPFYSECWSLLNLTHYLNDVNVGWFQTTPTCNATESGSTCCLSGEPWTTCFLRLGRGKGGADCSQINAKNCPGSWDGSDSLATCIRPEVDYVMQTIWGKLNTKSLFENRNPNIGLTMKVAINNFFSTWYDSIAYSLSSTQLTITNIINELDPKQQANTRMYYVLVLLTVGLAFLGAPELAAMVASLSFTTRLIADTMTIALQQAPTVARAFWPQGVDTQNIQIGQLDTALANLTGNLSATINNGLMLVMSDMPTFIAFASGGTFSGNSTPSLPNGTAGLDYALRTYITTTAMSANGWRATAHPGYTTKYEVMEDFGNIFCNSTEPSVNICGNEAYWSSATNTVYYLTQDGGYQTPTPYKLMTDIVVNEWADLENMFDAGYNCTATGRQGSNAVSFHEDGTLDLSCISQLKFKIACGAPCPVQSLNGICPFDQISDGKC
ncbi:hypothetical protein MMC06_000611 [Schaereria dolodes]|nr:hypothetical protein [Schaereria dolodes]